jgi:hypothetical protein
MYQQELAKFALLKRPLPLAMRQTGACGGQRSRDDYECGIWLFDVQVARAIPKAYYGAAEQHNQDAATVSLSLVCGDEGWGTGAKPTSRLSGPQSDVKATESGVTFEGKRIS